MKLFVYGTLRSGAPMHGLLAGDAHPLGPARAHACLLDLGHFPGLVHARAESDWVIGELFEVSAEAAAALMDRLDRYEGDAFVRQEHEVLDPEGAPVSAWVYLYVGDASGGLQVDSGDWLAHLHAARQRELPLD